MPHRHLYDITLLTDARYVRPQPGNWYVENIFADDGILRAALEARGLRVHRTNWDDPGMDWRLTRSAMFRTTWDYFDRFIEFSEWLHQASTQTLFINDLDLIWWNMDKVYLRDLERQGIPIPPTAFIPVGETRSLAEVAAATGWDRWVLKPNVSGAARHTYLLDADNLGAHEAVFRELIGVEAMLLQQFQQSVFSEGELTLMVMDGRYTHAVRKRAKAGDFRVQDDFGGTVHDYSPSADEIAFAEAVVRTSPSSPAYARVDLLRDNTGRLCVSELEAIEPELWLRRHPAAAEPLADAVVRLLAGA